MNKRFYFLDAMFYLLDPQIFLIYSKRRNLAAENNSFFCLNFAFKKKLNLQTLLQIFLSSSVFRENFFLH